MKFLDAHQHLVYREKFTYKWLSGVLSAEGKGFTLEDYTKLNDNHRRIAGSIYVESDVGDVDYKKEAHFISSLVGTDSLMGQIAACRPEEIVGFEDWLDETHSLNVVGYCRSLHKLKSEVAQSSVFISNLKKIGKLDKVFDINVLDHQLPLVVDLARVCDDQYFVLNHFGMPNITDDTFERWARDIKAISALSHVYIKLSGIPNFCQEGAEHSIVLRRWFDRVLECFGPERIIWGSFWPTVNLSIGLTDWMEVTTELICELTAGEQALIAADNAHRVYKVF